MVSQNNFNQNSPDNENFWEGIVLPKSVRRRSLARRLLTFVMCLFFVAVGFGIAMIAARGNGWFANLISGDKHINFTLPVADKPKTDDKDKDSDGKYTVEGLAKAMSPSVVYLEVYTKDGSIMPTGQGSGIIISKNGYIVTNAHVVDGAKNVKAVLSNMLEYDAKIIGVAKESDLAVVKINAANLTPAVFGNSSQVNLGEDVVAIGSPGGYVGTLTQGVVSGLGRVTKLKSGVINDCIQVDAAINPGSSGGALFNMWGQVIGVTSSKLSAEDYDGIGFAISSNYAKPVIENIMSDNVKERGVKIGISYYVMDEKTAKEQKIEPGIVIADITKGSFAASSGLKKGDVVTEIDGKKTAEISNIPEYIKEKGVGKTVKFHVYRYGKNGKYTQHDFEIEIIMDDP